ncbi:ABC transporter permease [Paenibacillus sp. 1P07SE]|uniref:ABC transporter permease n=1 Tax=Paenibacillus sp. 1P07SE TaxID=3132209 RepID=UPI0039A60BAE
MFLPVAVFFLVFKYAPMAGVMIAFKEYNFIDGVWGSPWAGLANFELLFSQPSTLNIIRNTFLLSVLELIVMVPFPIMLAILLYEAKQMLFRKTVQTLAFIPHFLSWVIVGGITVNIFAQESGVVNKLMHMLTGETFAFLYHPVSWVSIFLASGVWKEAGYAAIIYLAALTVIDPSLYEAASLDGAGKLKRIWHVTLPGILPTIFVMLIISMGRIMEVGFDKVYMLQNDVVSSISEVISTYIYKVGLQGGYFSLSAAMGLFESVVALILVLGSNWLARRFDQGLW